MMLDEDPGALAPSRQNNNCFFIKQEYITMGVCSDFWRKLQLLLFTAQLPGSCVSYNHGTSWKNHRRLGPVANQNFPLERLLYGPPTGQLLRCRKNLGRGSWPYRRLSRYDNERKKGLWLMLLLRRVVTPWLRKLHLNNRQPTLQIVVATRPYLVKTCPGPYINITNGCAADSTLPMTTKWS